MEIGSAVVKALFSGSGSPRAMLDALGKAAGERRLLVYSARPTEQALLASTPLGGVLSTAPGPYAALVVNNGAGNKLDYYLGRSLSYSLGACSTAERASVITATLTNGAPSTGLPEYAAFRLDRTPGYGAGRGGDGSTLEIVQVYARGGRRAHRGDAGRCAGVGRGRDRARTRRCSCCGWSSPPGSGGC